MAVMEVVHYGDPILRKKCNAVTNYEKIGSLIDDMFDTMYEENGLGLAANQVGVDLNLFIIDISAIEEKIKFKFEDLSGKEHIEGFEGLMARAIQHEMDHLNGIFIVDRVSQTDKMSVHKSLRDIEKSSIEKSKIRRDFVL